MALGREGSGARLMAGAPGGAIVGPGTEYRVAGLERKNKHGHKRSQMTQEPLESKMAIGVAAEPLAFVCGVLRPIVGQSGREREPGLRLKEGRPLARNDGGLNG
jgi:hypothetical protein